MVSTAHKYIFIHVPKTAGSSMEEFLYTPDCIWQSGVQIFLNQKLISQAQHFTLSEIKKIMEPNRFNQYKKISAVRNPWDRMVSSYFFQKNALKRDDIKDFNHFIDIIGDKEYAIDFFGGEHGGQHFFSQVDFLKINNCINIDLLLRFEEINTWSTKLKTLLKDHPLKDRQFPKINFTQKRSKYRSYYNEKTCSIIAEVYKDDILQFNYTF